MCDPYPLIFFPAFPCCCFFSHAGMALSAPNRFCVNRPWGFSHVLPPYLKDPHPPLCMIESSTRGLPARLKLPSSTFLCPSQPRNICRFCDLECSLFTLAWQLLRVQGNIFVFLYVFLLLGIITSSSWAETAGHSFFPNVAAFPYTFAKHLLWEGRRVQ